MGSEAGRQEILIAQRRGWFDLNLLECWSFRDLLLTLAWRDISVRYKQTALGVAWAVLQPLAAMLIFTAVFSRMAGLSTDGLPAPLFYYSGLLAWTFFAQTVLGANQSIIDGSRIITKVYFPRVLIPASVIGYTLLDLAVSAVLLVGMMAWYGVIPDAQAFLLLPIMLLLGLTALGCGIFISALTVQFRDFRYVVPFLLQIGLFATPVVYSASIIPLAWRNIAALNPMAGIIEGFRAGLFGLPIDWCALAFSAIVGVFIFIFSLVFFSKMEDTMADIL